MKAIHGLLSILIILFCSNLTMNAQWVQCGGTVQGNVLSFATDGTKLFAGTEGAGVYYSANMGTTWTEVNTGLFSKTVSSMVIVGNSVFAGTADGVFVSNNNGTSWARSGLTSLVVNSMNLVNGKIYAGTYGIAGGAYSSSNNGSSWLQIGLDKKNVWYVTPIGSLVWAGTETNGILQTTNNGLDWEECNKGISFTDVRAIGANSTNLFAGTWMGGVYTSLDGGMNWTSKKSGMDNTFVRTMIVYNNNIFAGTTYGVYLSTDNGESWANANNGLKSFKIYSLYVKGQYIYASTDAGTIYRANLKDLGITDVNDSKDESAIRVSPNPSSDFIYMNNPKQYSANIRIYNTLGALVLTVRSTGSEMERIDITSLPSGLYFISLNNRIAKFQKQ